MAKKSQKKRTKSLKQADDKTDIIPSPAGEQTPETAIEQNDKVEQSSIETDEPVALVEVPATGSDEPEDENTVPVDTTVASPDLPTDNGQPTDIPTLDTPVGHSDTSSSPEEVPRIRRRRRMAMWCGLAVMVLAVAALLLHSQWPGTQSDTQTTQADKALVAEVADRAVLPTGEKPAVTTVVDKNKANQPFLANAANGDKVLLYFRAGKAIVYRPSTHQVVNIGPLAQPPARVFVRAGTADDVPASLLQKLSNGADYTIVSQDKSAKQNYAKTLVIDVEGNRPDIANRIAHTIGGQVSSLPSGESRPDADFLIIVGADAQ